jgi:formate-dependent nitrite reductase membrane component NrfD
MSPPFHMILWEDREATGSGYATGTVIKAPAWHGLVAWDMLFNGMTTGLFLIAAISELVAPDLFTAVAKAASPVALVLRLVDLLFLVLDLGDPLFILSAVMFILLGSLVIRLVIVKLPHAAA